MIYCNLALFIGGIGFVTRPGFIVFVREMRKARDDAAALQASGEAEAKERHEREREELKAGEAELAALLAAHLLGEEE